MVLSGAWGDGRTPTNSAVGVLPSLAAVRNTYSGDNTGGGKPLVFFLCSWPDSTPTKVARLAFHHFNMRNPILFIYVACLLKAQGFIKAFKVLLGANADGIFAKQTVAGFNALFH